MVATDPVPSQSFWLIWFQVSRYQQKLKMQKFAQVAQASLPGWYVCIGAACRRFTVSNSTASRVWRKHQETGQASRRGGGPTKHTAARRDL